VESTEGRHGPPAPFPHNKCGVRGGEKVLEDVHKTAAVTGHAAGNGLSFNAGNGLERWSPCASTLITYETFSVLVFDAI
jgi:hypothetical protein